MPEEPVLPPELLGDVPVVPAALVPPQPLGEVVSEPGVPVPRVAGAVPPAPRAEPREVTDVPGHRPAPVPPAPELVPLPVDELLPRAQHLRPAAPAVPGRPSAVQPQSAAAVTHQPLPQPSWNGPRVELGFADGTYRMLDPESPAARALSELVGEMTSSERVTDKPTRRGSEPR